MNWYKKIILASLPAYNFREFVKKLQDEFGVQFLRQGKGDDQIWGIPGTGRGAKIPFSAGNRMINPKTMVDILRNLKIPLREFKKITLKKTLPTEQQEEHLAPATPEIPEWQNTDWYRQQQQYANSSRSIKNAKWKDHLPGGRADKKKPKDFNEKAMEIGQDIEFEHTDNPDIAKEIAMDHLEEFDKYYDDKIGLPAMERNLEQKKKKL